MQFNLEEKTFKTKFGSFMFNKLYETLLQSKIKYSNNTELLIDIENETKYELNKFLFYINKKIIKSPQNNISFWLKKTPREFQDFIYKLDKKYEQQQKNKQIKKIYENDLITVLMPKTYESCAKYGKNTKWCITDKKTTFYWIYYTNNKKENIFYFLPKKDNEKYVVYVYHFHITDKNDKNISVFDFFKILLKYKISFLNLCFLFLKFKFYRHFICFKPSQYQPN